MDGDSPPSNTNDKDEGAVGIVTDDEFERKLVVVNELLFFVSNYCKGGSATPENIKRIVTGFYEDNEIWTAKKLLWKFVDQNIIKKFEKRKDTQARSAKVANTEDIIKAFTDMDKVNYEDAVFVAADIKRVPTQHPEELHDLSMVRRIEALEKNFKLVEAGTSGNQAKIEGIISSIGEMKGLIDSNTSLIHLIAQQVSSNPSSHVSVPDQEECPCNKNIPPVVNNDIQ